MHYKTWLLDCDGVLLDSNRIKSDAFYEVALPFGEEAARALVEYHQKTGGISRFEKMVHLQREILHRAPEEGLTRRLVEQFGAICHNKLLACPETPGLRVFLERISGLCACHIVSGGREDELQSVFEARGLARYFRSINGSPRTKLRIIEDLREGGCLLSPIAFVGDSRYDYETAQSAMADFFFMTSFTEFGGHEDFFRDKPHTKIQDLTQLQNLVMS